MIPSNRAECEFGSGSTDVPTETIEQPSGGYSKQYFVIPCVFLGKQARKVKQWQKNGFKSVILVVRKLLINHYKKNIGEHKEDRVF